MREKQERILNLENEGDRYVEFHGDEHDTLHILLEDRRKPISVADTLRRRLEVLELEVPNKVKKQLVSAWWDYYPIDTGDGVAYHPSGTEFKVMLDAPFLQDLNRDTLLKVGNVALGKDKETSFKAYECLEGKIVTLEYFEHYYESGDKSTKEGFVTWLTENPFWKILARGDTSLLKAYAEVVHTKAKEAYETADHWGYSTTGERIYMKHHLARIRMYIESIMQVCMPTVNNYDRYIFSDGIAFGSQWTVDVLPFSGLISQAVMDPNISLITNEPRIIGVKSII